MIRQEGGTSKTASDATADVNDGGAMPTCQLLDVTHDEELEEHCDHQLKQPVQKIERDTQVNETPEATGKSILYFARSRSL